MIFLVTGSKTTLVPARRLTIARFIIVDKASADWKLPGVSLDPPRHAAINLSNSGGSDPILGAVEAAWAAAGAPAAA